MEGIFEIVLAWSLQTTKTDVFLYISFIQRKTENLGTYFNKTACYNTGIIIFIEAHKGNKNTFYTSHIDLNLIIACYL